MIVFALVLLSIGASLHHHRLAVPGQSRAIGGGSGEDHPARSIDCVACRAVDAARLADAGIAVPQVDVAGLLAQPAELSVPSFASEVFPPRGPPAQSPS